MYNIMSPVATNPAGKYEGPPGRPWGLGSEGASAASFRPAATGVSLAAPLSATVPNVFTYPWTVAAPRGGYVLFLAAVKANTPTDIVTLATTPLSLP